ncbi:MAG: GDP-mannose 4,6-dehydratase [Deltaproteobacteria bacterium]|nr:GDP-mannose 4,6-dehydratase [Deltaproteobacteria bacterium]
MTPSFETFVTRKITRAVARIKLGLQEKLYIGNLDASRDWGYAVDFVRAMWLILQQDIPDDYVIATGESHSVREFVERAFSEVGISIVWEGSGIKERGKDSETGRTLLEVDPGYFRPTEVDSLLGDPSRARLNLGWEPSVTFDDLVKIMVKEDLKQAEMDQLCDNAGFRTFTQFE